MALMHPTFPLPDLTDPITGPFWDAAARGELALPRCGGCGAWCWYPRESCRGCGTAGPRWTPVAGRGRLFSFAVVRRAFLPAFADLVPFATGLVTLDEAPGVRLATRIVDAPLDDLAIDTLVEVVFRPLVFPTVEGSVTAPMFRPRSRD
jgi:uncharacterized OB-fold protein